MIILVRISGISQIKISLKLFHKSWGFRKSLYLKPFLNFIIIFIDKGIVIWNGQLDIFGFSGIYGTYAVFCPYLFIGIPNGI